MRLHRSERGSTLPLIAMCIVTLMVAAALSVDVGMLTASNRRLQAVADMAALDGSRELTGTACNDTYVLPTDSPAVPSTQYDHVVKAVTASAKRNDFVPGGDKTLVVEIGTVSRDAAGIPTFTALPSLCSSPSIPDSVRVRAGDRTGFSFANVIGQSGRNSSRAATGTLEGRGAFRLGSSMATFDTSKATLLNPILSQTICRLQSGGCNIGLTAVGYQGLADTSITYGALATQLGFLTTEEMFDANVKIDDILNAAAILGGSSTTAGLNAQTAIATITAAVSNTATVNLGKLVSADLQDGNQAAFVAVDLFRLVMGTAAIANDTNAISIPNTAVTIPYVSTVTAGLDLVEAPITIGDRAGASGTTKQLKLTITPNINLTSAINPVLSLLNLTSITGSLPIVVNGGSATGTLNRVRCGADKGIDTTIAVNAASISASGTLNITLPTSTNVSVLQDLVGTLGTVTGGKTINTTLAVSGTGMSTTVGSTNVSFAYPSQFGPAGTAHVGNTTIGLNNLMYGSSTLTMSIPLENLLGISVGSQTVTANVSPAGIVALLSPVMTAIDNNLVKPLMDALGLELGAADVTALSMLCGVPTLAG